MSRDSDWDIPSGKPDGWCEPDALGLGEVRVHWPDWAKDGKLVADFFNSSMKRAAEEGGSAEEKTLVKIMLSGETPPMIVHALAHLARAVAMTEAMFWLSFIAKGVAIGGEAAEELAQDAKARERAAIAVAAVMCLNRDMTRAANGHYPGISELGHEMVKAVDPDGSLRESTKTDLKDFLMKNLPNYDSVEGFADDKE